ncbi:acetylxylan esterase [Kiritimatiellaeota bacterium B1221]|nr:acetylxylan esterase [Kiritimatiellaeota bacterium B1221]
MQSCFKNFVFFVLSSFSLLQADDFFLAGRTDKDVAIYEPGEAITFQMQVLEDGQPVAGKKISWSLSFDGGKNKVGEEIAGEDGLTLVTEMDAPGFVRLEAKAFDEEGNPLQGTINEWGREKQGAVHFEGGACVQPEKLRPVEEPEDFDAFWQGMKDKLAAVPMVVERKELPSPDPNVKLYAISIPAATRMPLTGYLSVPIAEAGTLKAKCSFHGYGFNEHKAPNKVDANQIVFNVNAHGMSLGEDPEYYAKLKKENAGYGFRVEENVNPETAYFHDMSLRVMRAFEFVKSLPEWNGKDLESHGGSQGGLQGLWGAGLDPDVSTTQNWSPWCCDLAGITVGRLKGWRPKYTEALAYYDPVFHVRRTRAEVNLIANYGDYTCPPSSVWMVYNEVPHKQKSMEVRQGCSHSYTMKPYLSFTITPEGISDVGLKNK